MKTTRLWAILLILCMALSLMSVAVFASQGDANITEVNINGVTGELWNIKNVTFATVDEKGNYFIESQEWYSEKAGRITPVSESLKPTEGECYTFSVTLKAKAGYVFSAGNTKFKLHGNACDAVTSVTADGKTLTARLFEKTNVKRITDTAGSTIITTINKHFANASASGKIKITKDAGFIFDKSGERESTCLVWLKADGENLVETEDKDEALICILVTYDNATITLTDNAVENAVYTLKLDKEVYGHLRLAFSTPETDPETGKITIYETRDEYYVNLKLDCTVKLLPKPVEDISEAIIKDAKFDYLPGDAPRKSAVPFFEDGTERYEIMYECWEEIENGIPVAFWYSDESKNSMASKKITQFEEGKTYVYSLLLREKGVYEFANNCTVSVNGNTVNALNVMKNEEEIFVAAIKTVTVYRDADYTAVDSALKKVKALNKDEYKDFSAVESAVNAVVRGKKITEQQEVDKMAQAINDAIAGLEYKDADYTAVDSALEKVKALNKNEYKDFSAVESAVNAVVRGKKITEQAEVDKMAQAINDAVAGLEKKTVDSKGSGTGDTDGTGLWIAVMSVFAVLAGTAVIIKKKKTV